MNKVKKIQEINNILQKNLPVALIGQCRAVNIREQTLVISVSSPTWKASLRFQVPGLLRDIQRERSLNIQKIEIITEPARDANRATRRRSAKISSKSADLIQAMADSMDDPQLKQALNRLSRNQKEKK